MHCSLPIAPVTFMQLASLLSILSPLAGNMYAPPLDFSAMSDVDNTTLTQLTVSNTADEIEWIALPLL